ncbi:hypothetical protein [Hymenobacter terricola]|uniref:hypothetical protein n=1 Tax=Hymenobacter terricola TaxID=2819236 RepID=UPI001B30B805|nr:hypothetical protein [Hymenobacter terricola]
MPRKPTPKQTTTLFYPASFKLNELRDKVTSKYASTVKEINYFFFFNLLLEEYFTLSSKPGQYIQVHSDIIRCIFRDEYKQILKDLADTEYIQIYDGHSDVLGICISYRIHPKRIDLSAPFAFVEEEYNKYFARKLNTLKTLNLGERKSRRPTAKQEIANAVANYESVINTGYLHVMEQTQNLMLVPDADALAYVVKEYARLGNCNPPETYFNYFNNSPLKRVGIDKFGNRLQSVVTNMAKVIRRCLRFKTSPLIRNREIDIVNSQPFYLSSVTGDLIRQFVPDASEAIPVYERYENDSNFLEFKELAREGTIYERLQADYEKQYGAICDGDDKEKRDFTKKLTMSALFGDYDLKDSTVIEELTNELVIKKMQFFLIFKEQFQSIYELFKEIKSFRWNCTVNRDGERKQYANNCLVAQRLESGVMFKHIVQAVIDHDITEVITIHDCLLVREDQYDIVKAISDSEFQNLNLNPKFK